MEAAGQRVLRRLREELKQHDTSLRSLYGDGWSVGPLKDDEFRVLSAVFQLGEGALTDIQRIVENWAGGFRIANVLFVLHELICREFVTSRYVGPSDRPRPLFKITEEGQRALARAGAEGKSLAAHEDYVKGPCPERLI